MVIEKARELCIALSESQEFRRMLQARAAIEKNETLANTINLLQEKQRMIADLLAEGEAVSYTHLDVYKRQRFRRAARCVLL